MVTENQTVCSIVEKGSMKCDLQEIAFEIHSFCLKHSIILVMEWIPREQNALLITLQRL